MRKIKIFMQLLLYFLCSNALGQVTEFPYLCSFETGPDGAAVIDNEPNWDGYSDDWIYDDATSISGVFSTKAAITSSGDYSHLMFVEFDFSNHSNLQPSLWYWATNNTMLIRIVGRVNYGSWVILKDWFVPQSGGWQFVDYTEMSNLSLFDGQQICNFGFTAKRNGSSTALRIDDVQLIAGGGGNTTCTWLGSAANNNWHDAANWDVAKVPEAADDVVIPSVAANFPEITADNAFCNDLLIQAGGRLSVNSGFQLNTSGDLSIESNASTAGSLLNKGNLNIAGTGTFQTYIEGYTSGADGWHLVSTPVNSFNVAGSDFEPGNNDDLYQWDESSWQWLNYKANPFDFANGEGYLIAYENSGIRSYSGNFNNTDISIQDLSFGAGNGWHLLGNPFPCAIQWNDGNWNLNNVEGIAKIYNEAAGNYLDLSANSIIPATQGFFVRAASAVNSITIPAASRTHDATAFYKNEVAFPAVWLKIESPETGFYDINNLCFIPDASSSYDMKYDGHKIYGREEAPQMHMLCETGEFLSTNALPPGNFSNIELYFKAGADGQYILNAGNMNKLVNNKAIYIEDILNDSIFNLNHDSIYIFQASVGDPELRFRIRIEDANGENENSLLDGLVFQSNGRIYIRNFNKSVDVGIYELTGKLIHTERTTGGNACIRKEISNGIYLVKINNKVYKLIVSHGL